MTDISDPCAPSMARKRRRLAEPDTSPTTSTTPVNDHLNKMNQDHTDYIDKINEFKSLLETRMSERITEKFDRQQKHFNEVIRRGRTGARRADVQEMLPRLHASFNTFNDQLRQTGRSQNLTDFQARLQNRLQQRLHSLNIQKDQDSVNAGPGPSRHTTQERTNEQSRRNPVPMTSSQTNEQSQQRTPPVTSPQLQTNVNSPTTTWTDDTNAPTSPTNQHQHFSQSNTLQQQIESEQNKNYPENIGIVETDDKFQSRVRDMNTDKSSREHKEDDDDMMKYERAGMNHEEQKRIPALNETNNASYRYLRSVGNTYQYTAAATHPRLKVRLYRRFDTFDKDSDGIMTIQEVCFWAERMKTLCQATDEQIERIKCAVRIFFEACGLTEQGLHRENWVEGNRVFAEAERERKRRKEPSLVAMLGNTYYDILDDDTNHTNQRVSLQGLKRMMNVFRVPEEAAYTFFALADTERRGTVDRQQLHDMFFKFWLDKYNPEVDGLYAYKY